jgi:predicted nucleic acid-binding protein
MPRTKYGWDAGIFIALLTGERRPPGEMEGLREVVDAVGRGGIVIVTSAMATTEVLGDRDDPTVRNAFESLFRRPDHVMVDISPQILELARDIRVARGREGGRLKASDALYVATAVTYRCDALHAFDGGILALDGKPYVNGLSICKPRGDQTVLPL